MNYSIISNSGWKAGAHTQDDAISKAKTHKAEWDDTGVNRIVVKVYYRDGSLVFATDTQ